MNNWKVKFKSRVIYNSIKKYEMLRDKSNQVMQKLYTEKCKAVLWKIKELNVLSSQIRIFNILKFSVLAKLIHRFNTFPIYIPGGFFFSFCGNRQADSKMYLKKGKDLQQPISPLGSSRIAISKFHTVLMVYVFSELHQFVLTHCLI